MNQGKEKLSHSGAVHRREVLAKERRKLPSDFLLQKIVDSEQAVRRFGKVKSILEQVESELELTPEEQASLKIELIWLELKLERIKPPERDSRLQRTLNNLQAEEPEVYEWLTTEKSNGLTPLANIRNRVFPPTNIGGYYTKRDTKRVG